jgi:hypothetical protein
MTAYQLGTLAFAVGTAVWGVQAYTDTGAIDLAALTYAIGCALFLDDAFKLLVRRWPDWRTLHSYRAGSLAYAAGTVVWAVQAWRSTGTLDRAALLYGVGCAFFLLDAFAGAVRLPALLRRVPFSNPQLGALAFLVGTVVWGATGGISIPVAAYGLGCLFFIRDAFRARTV